MSTAEKQYPSCDERIEGALSSRVDDVRGLLDAMRSDNDEERDEAHVRASEYGLGLDVTRTVTWQLSWGGPSDEVRFHLDAEDNVERIEYAFKDWFDGASRNVTGEAFDTLRDFYEVEIRPFVECI